MAMVAVGVLSCLDVTADAARLQHWTAAEPPHFTLHDSNGGKIALDSAQGTVTIVHFFATWCEPCREELSALDRLNERSGAAIKILAISVAEPGMRVRRFLETMPLKFPVLLDPDRATAKSWSVSTLPTTIVLDANLKARLIVETDYAWDTIDPRTLIEECTTGERLRGSLDLKDPFAHS